MSDMQKLLDEREIVRGLARFARILDQKRWGDLSDVFDDLSFDYGGTGERQGMDALRANMQRFLDCCGGTQHLIGSILVDVDGDQASSRAYVQARHQGVDNPGGRSSIPTANMLIAGSGESRDGGSCGVMRSGRLTAGIRGSSG